MSKTVNQNTTLIHKVIETMEVKNFLRLRLKERAQHGAHVTDNEHVGLNGRVALVITNIVGTMWCAYVFAGIALISLPEAVRGGTATLVAWVAQTFLQLVLLSVIMVGQKVAAAASDKQALQTYNDAEALLKIQDEVHQLIQLNNKLTTEIHGVLMTRQSPTSEA
jgi:hypothetical protein